MAPMSTRLCFASRYTVPRKLSGSESWKSRPFTMTRSPTVSAPAWMSCVVSSMASVSEVEKMRFWPKLSAERECCVARAARSYAAWHSSKRRSSSRSLPKYLTCGTRAAPRQSLRRRFGFPAPHCHRGVSAHAPRAHRLVVDERVERARAALRVHAVHLDAELRAPCGHVERERRVHHERRHAERRRGGAALVREDAGDEHHLERGGHHVEDHAGEDEVDAARAAVDGLAQRARLAAEVVAEVEVVQVRENLHARRPRSTLVPEAYASVMLSDARVGCARCAAETLANPLWTRTMARERSWRHESTQRGSSAVL